MNTHGFSYLTCCWHDHVIFLQQYLDNEFRMRVNVIPLVEGQRTQATEGADESTIDEI